MKLLKFRSFKQILPSSAVAVAVLGLVGITSPARADNYVLCPNAASTSGYGGDTFTAASGGPASCGANSAVTMYIPNETSGYARLAWDSSAGYPAGLTLGNLGGVAANVQFTGSDEPFYMLAFTDLTKGLGQNNANDQILMIEFQPSALVGNTLGLNPTTTLFNLFDNVTGTYLGTGQSDVNTLA